MTRLVRAAVRAAVQAVVLLASRAAWACPSCARDTKGPLQALAIAGMILAPFAIGAGVALALRAEARRAAREDS